MQACQTSAEGGRHQYGPFSQEQKTWLFRAFQAELVSCRCCQNETGEQLCSCKTAGERHEKKYLGESCTMAREGRGGRRYF